MDFSKLPNLNALRAFECAARLESFSRAAEELFVTHGAVSHRIRTLEEDLGLPLFARDGKRVRLTEGGRIYAQQVRLAMMDIALATEAVRAGDRDRRLIVSVLPSFAARWLMPRVGRFIERHPEIDLELMAATALVDFRRDNVDVGIRLGTGDYPGLFVEKLMGETYFPVCAPGFHQGRLPQQPADLLSLPLLRSDDEPWRDWLDLAGLPDVPEPTRGTLFNDGSMILQSVLDGSGIALVRRSLAQDYLRSGRLVKLFDIESLSRNTYFFVCPEHVVNTPRVAAFKTWLVAEIGDFHRESGTQPA
jgi:LysR family transcriptional regulator, glycine cleavage system transcriptional activator